MDRMEVARRWAFIGATIGILLGWAAERFDWPALVTGGVGFAAGWAMNRVIEARHARRARPPRGVDQA